MIVKAYKYKGSAGARRLSKYLSRDTHQRTEQCEMRNLYVANTLDGMRFMHCLQRASRAQIAFWHIIISPTTKLEAEDRTHLLNLIMKELQATGHPLIVLSHNEKHRARRGGASTHFHCILGHVSPTTGLALNMRNHAPRLQKVAAVASFDLEGQTSISLYHNSIVTHLIREGRPDVAHWLTDLKRASPPQKPRVTDAMRRSAGAVGLDLPIFHAQLHRLWNSDASEQAFDGLFSAACIMIKQGDHSRDSVLLYRGDRLVGVLNHILRQPRTLVYKQANVRFPGLFGKPRAVGEITQSGRNSTIEQLRQKTTDRLEAMLRDMRTKTLMLTYTLPHLKVREEADENFIAERLKKTAKWEEILDRAVDILWSDDRWVSTPIEKLIISAGRSLNDGRPLPLMGPMLPDSEALSRHPPEEPAVVLNEDEVLSYQPYGIII